MGQSQSSKCIFCEIANEGSEIKDGKSRVLAENDKFAIFCDIKPAAKHHYLVVPKTHISNPKTLHTEDHIYTIEGLYEFAKDYCISIGVDCHNDVLFGFHWPPLISMEHLHLHIISPASEMSFVHFLMFKKDSRYFIHPDALVDWIKKKSNIEDKN